MAATYNPSEYIDMVIMYGNCGNNAAAAANLYAESFPNREHHPSPGTILGAIQRGRFNGNVLPAARQGNIGI